MTTSKYIAACILAIGLAAGFVSCAEASNKDEAMQQPQGHCFTLPWGNVAVCINSKTLQPCSVVNDTIEAHVTARRARRSNGVAYLVGTNISIGSIGHANIVTYDGLAWYAGECN